jgi:hypothetical protein
MIFGPESCSLELCNPSTDVCAAGKTGQHLKDWLGILKNPNHIPELYKEV